MRRRILLSLFLAFAWMAEWGSLSPVTFVGGFLLGLVILWLLRQLYDPADRPTRGQTLIRPFALVALGFIFLNEVAVSALSVLKEILRPQLRIQPGIVSVPLDVKTDIQITILANMVSLTPGTLSLDVSADGERLYVHALNVEDDGEAIRRSIKEHLERPILRALPTRS